MTNKLTDSLAHTRTVRFIPNTRGSSFRAWASRRHQWLSSHVMMNRKGGGTGRKEGETRDLAEEYLVVEGPVVVGGVEEGDALAEGVRDHSGPGIVVEREVVSAGQPQAPEPLLRHLHQPAPRRSIRVAQCAGME